MAKVRAFQKILNILVDADGGAVTKDYILKELEGEIAAYRLSSYIWDIKHYAKVEVESIRDGRKVVGYRVPVAAPVASSDEPAPTPEIPEGATPVASEADAIAVNRVFYDASQVDESDE